MVSIIIPNFNSGNLLKTCLDAIAAANSNSKEVIVVDDASEQPVQDMVASYGYRCLRLEKNNGQATARNEGAKLARGEILFFVDSDVAIRKNTLEKIEAAYRNQSVSVYQGLASKTPLNDGFGPKLLALKWYYMLKDCREASYVHSHLFSIKRSVFEEIGGFNTSFTPPGCGEEFELGHRLREKYIIHTDPELLAEHRFQNILPRTVTLFHRAYVWAKLLTKSKRFEKTNASLNEVLIGVCNVAAIPVLIMSFWKPFLLLLFLTLTILQIILNAGFYRFLFREEGTFFMLRAIVPNMIWSIAAVSGGAKYYLDRMCGRVK